ncbi:hypothetical protein Glove_21g19 [Diversispora epigaea]|uniref:F-box domain-containing protein n=1 Tax=Diversispora epigaea TaxID=1348612 RepID=A0A397JLD5_9GLOM|nr:hypothetical protein Glove_21g19 [Diversispora epigaea]
MSNLLDLLPLELISSITKNLPIQDLKNCSSLDDIWKDEVIREICKRLIADCTFIVSKTTVKALIDPKSCKKPWNSGKKVMRRGWIDREKVSVTLPNIFESEKLKSLPRYLNETFTNFVVIDKPEYNLILGSSWLTRRGVDITR